MKRLQHLLQSRYASIVCIIFAFTNRIIFTTLYSSVGRDTKLQLNYAENFLAGKSLSVTKYFAADLDKPVNDAYQFFPPGFSFSIIPFLKLFNGDEFKAVLAFDIIAAIIFIISVRVLCKKIGLPVWINNILTLIAGCSQYSFFMSFSSTDTISISLVLFSLSMMIEFVNNKKSLPLVQVILCGLLFSLPAFFRYMYLPIAVIFPLFILFAGILAKNRQLKTNGFWLILSTAFFLVLPFAIASANSDNVIHVANSKQGIFFDHLSHWYPFLPASLINIDFIIQQIDAITGAGYSKIFLLMEIINVVLFFLLLFLFFRYLINNRKNKSISRPFIFIVGGAIISIIIILMLGYLSLTSESEDWNGYKWTYVHDWRYFAFFCVFIPVLFFTVVNFYSSRLKKRMIKILAFAFACCFAVEVLHGIYYNIKIVTHHKDLTYIRDADMSYKRFPDLLAEIKKQNSDRQILVCSPEEFYLHTASQQGCKAIFDYSNVNKTDIRLSVKGLLVLVLHPQDASMMKEYIEKNNPRLVSTINGTAFYTQEINPQ